MQATNYLTPTLDLLQRRHGSLPRGRQGLQWRTIDPPILGCPQGIPSMRGFAVATNGILVAIMAGSQLVVGHIQSFLPECGEDYERVERLSTKERTARPHLTRYVE